MAKITNESAIQMFNMCAYLAPDAIPIEIFIRGKETLPDSLQCGINDNLQRDAILADLVRYSLLGPERDESIPGDEKRLFYMHRLLQEVVQENLKEDSSWLAHCLNLICNVFNWDVRDKELMNSFKWESPHAVTVAEKSYKVFTEDNEKLYNIAHIYFGLSLIHTKMLYLDSAKSYSDRCIEITERFSNESAIAGNDLFMAYSNRGNIYTSLIKYNEAIKDYDKSIAIGEQLRTEGKLYCELAMVYMNRGIAYHGLESYEKALSDKDKSIEIYERLYKDGRLDDENKLALAYMNRGVTYEAIKKYNEALSDSDTCIGIWKRLKSEEKEIDENQFSLARVNREVTKSRMANEKNEERLSDEGAAIYNSNTSTALLNFRKKQQKEELWKK